MAAHAAMTASLWSIAAVLACDRCDGVQEGGQSVASARRLASAAVASQRAQQLGVLFPLAAQRGGLTMRFLPGAARLAL